MSDLGETAPLDRVRREAARVILATPDEAEAEDLAGALRAAENEVTVTTDPARAAELCRQAPVDVIVADGRFVQGGPDDLLDVARERDREVLVLSDHDSITSAVTAMSRGALAYLPRPVSSPELVLHVLRAVERSRLEREVTQLRRQIGERYGFEGIVGTSPKMRRVIEQLKLAAPTDASVLILGESGTGKELVARSIHWNSPRQRGPFVALHLQATPGGLLESELFGHRKGAFTDAKSDRIGKLEAANGGTLFLDELGDMPLETQSKLLRVLETRTFERVGSNEPIRSDFRLIAATNQDLKKMIEEKKFREELYFRINVVPIVLPPLRERTGDIPLIVERFLRDAAAQYRKPVEGISPAALRLLQRQPWKGNIRELKNTVERMVILARGTQLEEEDVPLEYRAPGTVEASGMGSLAGMSLDDVEREVIKQTLEATGGNRKETAERLKIGERTLYRKIERYGL
ncbi:MAG TPA: sigma-54 dependent transcriptional regulator [Planctomycetota bacterium]|nr:sigma-54 dependent transcriptional regulator [Planctomycetota bacterium]